MVRTVASAAAIATSSPSGASEVRPAKGPCPSSQAARATRAHSPNASPRREVFAMVASVPPLVPQRVSCPGRRAGTPAPRRAQSSAMTPASEGPPDASADTTPALAGRAARSSARRRSALGSGVPAPARGARGRVAERFKALVLKTSDGESRPWVRIPPLPPPCPRVVCFQPLRCRFCLPSCAVRQFSFSVRPFRGPAFPRRRAASGQPRGCRGPLPPAPRGPEPPESATHWRRVPRASCGLSSFGSLAAVTISRNQFVNPAGVKGRP
jgi:hypothetical protein